MDELNPNCNCIYYNLFTAKICLHFNKSRNNIWIQ